ncbi:hypothetical protein ACFOON_15120 [Novosphingobium piscinae]|uniref:Uncharacterized protein n=1 Tax=Novosphingobium piscinae TaxID=1507448 RepID=A0A7X1FXC5_9SPHN|nr:hypothetical protein [Novosphingobium piscinae]MBC2668768.1 hypothetical protein [Novosphingobium piscinae]
MSALTDFFENRILDFILRGQALGITGASAAAGSGPTSTFLGLYRATAGVSPRSTAVTVGQTTVPATSNGRMYRCTTAGTTGASEPTWGTTNGGTTSDGTAVWTEMTPDFDAMNANVTAIEVSGGGYGRVSIASSLANWAGTQAAASTTASTGSSGQTSNNGTLTFPTPTANWGTVAAMVLSDASSGGNGLFWGVMQTPKVININDVVPVNPAGFSLTLA